MSHEARRITIPATVERIDISTALCGGRNASSRHRVGDHGGGAAKLPQTDWSADDQIIGRIPRIAVAFLAVAASFVFFPSDGRTETETAQVTLEVVKAFGEGWDPTGTVYSALVCNVIAERIRTAGGQNQNAFVGQINFLQHDLITGEAYFATGPVRNPAPIRGNLASASYHATIPLSRYDQTTGTFVEIGMVTIEVDLTGDGPIVNTKGRSSDKDPSNFNLRQSFVSSTRNAVPAFAIDGVEVGTSEFDSLVGFMTVSRGQQKYTVHP